MYLARRWLFRDTELDRKQLPWHDPVPHECYAYNVARRAVKASTVLRRTGYVIAQILTRFATELDQGMNRVTNADKGTKIRPLAIVRHETQSFFTTLAKS